MKINNSVNILSQFLKNIKAPQNDNDLRTASVTKSFSFVSEPEFFKSHIPLNFKGVVTSNMIRDFKNFEDVHCPICGVKVLSRSMGEKLFEEGKNIKDPQKFVSWLESNKESIPNNLRNIVDISKRVAQMSVVKDMDTFFDFMNEQVHFNLNSAINKVLSKIETFEKKYQFNESDKMLLDECKVRLSNLDLSKDFVTSTKEIYTDTVLSMDNEVKNLLYYHLKSITIPAGVHKRIFSFEKTDDSQERQLRVLKRLFAASFLNYQKVYTIEGDDAFDSNILLVCNKCEKLPLVNKFYNYQDTPDLLKNYEQYLIDVSRNIVENDKYKMYMNYPVHSFGLVKHLTRRGLRLNFNHDPYLRAIKVNDFVTKRDNIEFPFVNYDGVPCATCGMPTINHETKEALFEEILETKNLNDIKIFFEKNYQRFHRYYKPIIKFYIRQLKAKPSISEKDMYAKLRMFLTDNLNQSLLANYKFCDEIFPQLTNPQDFAYVEQYKRGLMEKFYNKISHNEAFDFEGYKTLLADTIYNISDIRIKSVYGTKLKESIRRASNTRTILFPNQETIDKVGGPIKLLAQDLIKGSVATIDHNIAKNNDGDDSPENISVMCKHCNAEKTNYTMRHWYFINNKYIAENMQKYLNYIIDLIKTGKEKDFDFYPKDYAKNVFEATKGKINLKYE